MGLRIESRLGTGTGLLIWGNEISGDDSAQLQVHACCEEFVSVSSVTPW